MKRRPLLAALTASAVVALGPGTASAGTEYRTVFKRALLHGNGQVRGQIDSAKPDCVLGREIVVHRRWHGKRERIGIGHTGSKGHFKIPLGRDFPFGSYRIKAKQTEIGKPSRRVTCLRRVNRTLGVHPAARRSQP